MLGTDYDGPERAEIQGKVSGAEEDAKDEVWASYRFIVLTDTKEPDRVKVVISERVIQVARKRFVERLYKRSSPVLCLTNRSALHTRTAIGRQR